MLGPSPPKSSLLRTKISTGIFSEVVAISSTAVGKSLTGDIVIVTVAVEVSPLLSAMV